MGGLLVKEYLRQATSTAFLDKLIFAGTPQLGAPKAFKALTYGDNFDFQVAGLDILNQARVKAISQNMPAVYELLPSQQYFQDIGKYLFDYRTGVNHTGFSFASTSQFMKDSGRNASLVDRGAAFHQQIDGFEGLGDKVYNVAGCKRSTIGGIRLYNKGKFGLVVADGDGTVPLGSANSVANVARHYFLATDHTGLIKDQNGIDVIKNILNDTPDEVVSGVSQDIGSCTDHNAFTYLFGTHSPVVLHVYDSQGRHTGPDVNGDIELGIPGSDYETIEDNNFVFVPGNDTYRAVLDATASGTADFDISSYTGTTVDSKVNYLQIPLASGQTSAELSFSGIQNNLDLKLDSNGDGTVDSTLVPSTTVTGDSAADIEPSQIVITSPGAKEYLRSEILPMTVGVTDSGSGVKSWSKQFDDRVIPAATLSVDLFFEKLGSHVFKVSAYDNAGNPSERTVVFTLGASIDSTISDVNRAASLKWITQKGFEKQLLADLSAAIKIEKVIEFLKDKNSTKPGVLKRIERLEKRLDKVLGKEFLKALETHYKKGKINVQAYTLLTEDINWLLNH